MRKFFAISFLCALSCFVFAEKKSHIDTETYISAIASIDATSNFDATETDDLKILNIAISDGLYSLDPHISTYHTEAQIQTALYEGLFCYASDAVEPVPALCQSYKISRDKKRWTFTLRENIKWSDGTNISASDIKNSWLMLLANKDAQYSSLLDVIVGAKDFREGKAETADVAISAPNDKTLSVRLVEPTAHLPHLLCHSSLTVVKKDLSCFSGPFVISQQDAKKIVLEKNENYWDKENVSLEKINVFIEADADEATHLFNTGRVDWIIENADVSKIINKNSVQVSAEFASMYLFFKNRKTEHVCNNANFRNALLEAVPWDEIRSNFIIPATTLIYPIANYPPVDGFAFTDANEAALLMQDARKEMGFLPNEKITLTLALGEHMQYMQSVTNILNNAWKPLGVELTTLNVRGDYFANIQMIDADLFVYNWIGDFSDPVAFLELFRGDSSLNQSGWKNEKYDSLLSESSYANGADRLKILSTAEQLLIDSAEILPVSHMVSVNVLNLNLVGGWTSNATNVHPFKFIFKKLNTQKIPGVI